MDTPAQTDQTLLRSPGSLFNEVIKKLGINNTALGARLGVSRQYVGAVIKEQEVPSEEKLRIAAKLANLNPDQVILEVRRYLAWAASPEGVTQKAFARKAALLDDYTLRGVRILTAKEIDEARAVELISISRSPTDEHESSDPVIGAINRYAVTCHFDSVCELGLSPLAEGAAARPAEEFVLPPRSSACVKMQEKFMLGSHAALQFNGVVQHLREQGLRASCDFLTEFEQEGSFLATLDNISEKAVTLPRGIPIASVLIFFNPFSGQDSQHQHSK